jgi:hypothetical protein
MVVGPKTLIETLDQLKAPISIPKKKCYGVHHQVGQQLEQDGTRNEGRTL